MTLSNIALFNAGLDDFRKPISPAYEHLVCLRTMGYFIRVSLVHKLLFEMPTLLRIIADGFFLMDLIMDLEPTADFYLCWMQLIFFDENIFHNICKYYENINNNVN